MGFETAAGREVTFTTTDDAPDSPTASLDGPADGGTISSSQLNNGGYIDVTFNVPSGETIDDSTVTDLAPEFSLSASKGTVTLDGPPPAVLISSTSTTRTYRYWVDSTGTDATTTLTLTPIDSAWALDVTSDGTTNPNSICAQTAFANLSSSTACDTSSTPQPTGGVLNASDVH